MSLNPRRNKYREDCVVVTLASGEEIPFDHCEGNQYTKGELTIEDRWTGNEVWVYPPGSWTCVIAYDVNGHYLYVVDLAPQFKLSTWSAA